jgi:glycosyltransferase involved in cell wall biosynthesis
MKQFFPHVELLEVYDERLWGRRESKRGRYMMQIAADRSKYFPLNQYCGDLDLIDWAADNSDLIEYVAGIAGSDNVVLWMEYPWLVKLLLRIKLILEKKGKSVRVVYSSGNVEQLVYQDIEERQNKLQVKNLGAAVKEIEMLALNCAHNVIACSASDSMIFHNLGASRVVTAENGVSRNSYKISELFNSPLYDQLKDTRYYLYAASDWPPNVDGIENCLGPNLGYLPPEVSLVVAGGVSRKFTELYLGENNDFDGINSRRLRVLGRLNSTDFAVAHFCASGYFLPVGYGGGTCLKTAEALYTGKPIVSSVAAARGFERFGSNRNMIISEFEDFSDNLTSSLERSVDIYLGNKEVLELEELSWDYIVSSLLKSLSADLFYG